VLTGSIEEAPLTLGGFYKVEKGTLHLVAHTDSELLRARFRVDHYLSRDRGENAN
jgi:hypothetical protein